MATEGFMPHWAKVAEDAGSPQYVFARHIADTRKVVFSRTLSKSSAIPGGWSNARLAEGDLTDEIRKLKKREDKNIIAYGGARFASSLIEKELIDEFHLLVNPVTIGSGLPLFGRNIKQNLLLTGVRSFDCGIALLRYDLPTGG